MEHEGLTYREIAEHVGVSENRVAQIELRALEKVLRQLQADPLLQQMWRDEYGRHEIPDESYQDELSWPSAQGMISREYQKKRNKRRDRRKAKA